MKKNKIKSRKDKYKDNLMSFPRSYELATKSNIMKSNICNSDYCAVCVCLYVHFCVCMCARVCEECGRRGREKKKWDGEEEERMKRVEGDEAFLCLRSLRKKSDHLSKRN